MVQTVPPAEIESELGRVWSSLQAANKMRACLFNLIVYTKSEDRLSYLGQIIQKVIERFPSRILFITQEEEIKEKLETAVSVLTAGMGEHEIVCDLIEIRVTKESQTRIPFLVLPHILPDLPIYLLHADDPSDTSPAAEQLKRLAHRIIFDSESSAYYLPTFATALLEQHRKSEADIADLSWARIEGWRQLFATLFKLPDALLEIQEAAQIAIDYNQMGERPCLTGALYLQSWIATQLRWNLKQIEERGESLHFHYENGKSATLLSIHPKRRDGIPAGRLLKITIDTHSNAHYSLKRDPHCPYQVIIEKWTATWCSLPTNHILDRDFTGRSLVKEICHKGSSLHYLHMLQHIEEMKGRLSKS